MKKIKTLIPIPQKILRFRMQRQLAANWCWAAVGSSVSKFFMRSSTWTQCKIASDIFSYPCCNNVSPCDQPRKLQDILSLTNNLDRILTSSTSFDTIRANIDAGKPVCIRTGWPGGGHFLTIYGYRIYDEIAYIFVGDPNSSRTRFMEFDLLSFAYDSYSTWTDSFFTKK